MKISIIYATRIRSEMLLASLESLFETTQGLDIEVIVVVDDDPITYEGIKDDPRLAKVVHNEERIGPVHSWNKGLGLSTGDMAIPASDDFHFEPGWLHIALEAHQKELGGYGLVGLYSRIHDVNVLSGMHLFDRKFCKDYMGGVIYPPHYQHIFGDKELDLKAKRASRFYGCADAVVTHIHPCENRRKPDANDMWRDTLWEKEEAIYNKRLAAGFPDDFEPVI